jgi:uncharacterized membrane protein
MLDTLIFVVVVVFFLAIGFAGGSTYERRNVAAAATSAPAVTAPALVAGPTYDSPALFRQHDKATGWTCWVAGRAGRPGGVFCTDKVVTAAPAEAP